MVCRAADEAVQQHQRGGQHQQDDRHADERTPGDEQADAFQQLHPADGRDAEGGREEGEAAGEDALAAMFQRLLGCGLGRAEGQPLFAVAGGHEDGVVHRRAQLDGADDDAGDEGQRVVDEIRDAHIDGDGRLDAGHQQHRNRQAAEGQRDDDQHRRDGPDVDVFEVLVRDLHEILHHGPLAGDEALGVRGLDEADQLVHLRIEGVAAGFVAAVGEDELIAAVLHDVHQFVRQKLRLKAGACDGVEADHLRDAVHPLDLVAETGYLRGRQLLPDEDEVVGHHAKVFAQLVRAHDAGHILRQSRKNIVVDVRPALGQPEGDHQQEKDRHHRHRVLGDKMAQMGEPRHEGAVAVFFHPPVKEEDERGQDDDGAEDAQRHALRHDDAKVCAQRQLHGTEGQKARDGGEAGRRNGAHGLADGVLHRLFVGGTGGFFLLVAVEQEDGKIHRHAQLQDCRQRLGNETDLPQKNIRAKVIHQREEQPQHEEEGREPAFQREEEHQQTPRHGAEHIQGHLPHDQLLGVAQDDADAAEEAVLPQYFFDLSHSPHRLLADAGTTQLDDEDGGVVLAEQELLKVCRQHLHRHRRVQHIAEPEGVQHVRHLVDLGLHGQQLVCGHPLHGDHVGGRQMVVRL